jgi:hypothetical protein
MGVMALDVEVERHVDRDGDVCGDAVLKNDFALHHTDRHQGILIDACTS